MDRSYFEPLKRINALKYFIGDELKISRNIKFCVVDLRIGGGVGRKKVGAWIDFMDKSKVGL